MHPTESGWIELKAADGTTMRVFTARPEGLDRAPGLIVFQEIFGVNGHIQEVCEGFARQGYVVAAPELFHRTAPGFQCPYTDFAVGRAEAAQMTLEGLEADLKALAGWFNADRQASGLALGAVGYCMGGRISFLANTILALACAISYYGGTIPNHL
ncbi:MAG TPA: dienelactone hydrolase family protein, partial [Holophagaceae bacterium]|nr:dienelactone hydrolase family protein [Holophagaceae bacterium]